jgi:hypothetical protein
MHVPEGSHVFVSIFSSGVATHCPPPHSEPLSTSWIVRKTINASDVADAVDGSDFVSSSDSGNSSLMATYAMAPPAKPRPAGRIGSD